ncbi:cell division protein ZipA [Gilvimarinus agarilyticus]|uniref:cell division protein ZipA n=1 Tax=Gilvimarinus sp. 2_MG-2023 TaxID=3062666 RepID=UPI001C0909DD|nr:cell division protein ZipA [Gilvimarinus sp. 2_MG-2023]MBU2887119.1 cell division protein ZipA [Gilvimarinus agarilyticus]MDO6571778.1 cell division protein ZipA [Gilvimarinus sp. 2_MG-2023]
MKEWLTIIVVLLIIGILLDGWRRMRMARKDNIRVSKRARQFNSSDSKDDAGHYTSELPNGGARVIAKRNQADTAADPGQPNIELTPENAGTHNQQIPQQVSLNLDESVPMLMESVEAERKADAAAENSPTPNHGAENTAQPEYSSSNRVEPSFGALDGDDLPGQEHEPIFSEPNGDFEYEQAATQNTTQTTSRASQAPSAPPESEQPIAQPDEVIIINVMAREGYQFAGGALLDVLLQCGLRYGDMNIFHRHEQGMGEGPIQFSLANMVQPGTFDLDNMENFATPGVSMFLTLPLRTDSIQAFDAMRYTAQTIAETLDGELKDEQRSIMTRQTMEHCRQRIVEYERKRLSRANA